MDYVVRKSATASQKKRLWTYFIIGAIAILAVLVVDFTIHSSFFLIKNFDIKGTREIPTEDIRVRIIEKAAGRILNKWLPPDNLLFWPNRLELSDYPFVKSVTIDKDFLKRAVRVTVEERVRSGIWCFAGGESHLPACFWFSTDGIVLEPAPKTEGGLVNQIIDTAAEVPAIGALVIAPEQFQVVQIILDALAARRVKTASASVLREQAEFHLEIASSPRLLFSLRFRPPAALFEFIDAQIKSGLFKRLAYIDFTTEKRIYTKPK